MVKKVYEEEIPEEDNNDSGQESENNRLKFLKKKPWT